MMEKKLEDCSVVELKALVYDRLAMNQKIQQEINVINQRIEELSKAQSSLNGIAPAEEVEQAAA